MSSSDIEAINDYIQRTTATTTAAREDQAGWIKWYNNLSFFDKMSDSTLQDASAKRDRFNIDNKTPPIPSVPLTHEEAEYWDNAGVDVTGMSPEQAQAAAWNTKPSKPMPVSMTVNRSTIKQGSTGDNVKEWQRIVGVTVDGKFGPNTVIATKAWQKLHNLTADGIVGPKTWGVAYGDLPTTTASTPSASTPASAQAAQGPAQVFAPSPTSAPQPSFAPATPAPKPTFAPTPHATGGLPEPVPTPKSVTQAGMFSFLTNLPNWAKWGLGIITLGGFAYGLKYHSEHTPQRRRY